VSGAVFGGEIGGGMWPESGISCGPGVTCNRAARIIQVCKAPAKGVVFVKTVRYGLVPLTFQNPDGSN
jgi:hypothetical protein